MSSPSKPKRYTPGVSGHLSAEDVLPEDVLRSVQEHFKGGRLYIPAPLDTLERDADICEEWEARRDAGEQALVLDREIGAKHELSTRRIQQITTHARLRGRNKKKNK